MHFITGKYPGGQPPIFRHNHPHLSNKSGHEIYLMKKKVSPSKTLALREERALSAKEFLDLADVPPEVEWFANIQNRQTRRAYQNDLRDFMRFAGIVSPEAFRVVTRAHLIAWRKDLEA